MESFLHSHLCHDGMVANEAQEGTIFFFYLGPYMTALLLNTA